MEKTHEITGFVYFIVSNVAGPCPAGMAQMIKWGLTFKAIGACLLCLTGLLYLAPYVEGISGGKK